MHFRKILLVPSLIIVGIIIYIVLRPSTSTLGTYHGISEDGKWETNFEVYPYGNEFLFKGEVICNDENLANKFSDDDLAHNQIQLFKRNSFAFGGNCIHEGKDKFIIINYALNNGKAYNKMTIKLGNYKTELKINKVSELINNKSK